jgi:hypothetical protein
MDFCVDEQIMNFIEPAPEKLSPMEQVRKDRFSIRQLKTLVNELEELAKQFGDATGGIPNKVVADLFLRKLENSKSLQDDGSLPEEWWGLREYEFQNMVRNLDREGKGVVSWKQLATFVILLRSPMPSDRDLLNFKAEFNKETGGIIELLDKDSFVKVKETRLILDSIGQDMVRRERVLQGPRLLPPFPACAPYQGTPLPSAQRARAAGSPSRPRESLPPRAVASTLLR